MKHFFAVAAGRAGSVAALLLALGLGRPAAGQGFSATRTDYATGAGPLGVAVVDVNADGRPDLLTVHDRNSTVGIRLAAGPAGAFATTRTDYVAAFTPSGLAVADVNADGRPDLLTYNFNDVSVCLAAGPAGAFAATPTTYITGIACLGIAAADVNADGRPDLLTTDIGRVRVRLADATLPGTFAPTVTNYDSGIFSYAVAAADVNADGRPDLLTTEYFGGSVSVRLADGPVGDFAVTLTDYSAGRGARSIAVVDVNADGRPDLVTGHERDNTVGVRLAAGPAGDFAPTRTDYPTGSVPYNVAVADVNADGRPDLVTVHKADNTVGIRLAAGPAGAFAPTRTDYATGRSPYDVAVVDVNADGRPDLITTNYDDNTVSVRLNTGTLATGAALAAADVAVYPNPTGGAAAIRISLPAAADPPPTATLLDALGRVVRPARALAVAGGQATGTLPTAGLPPGLYLLRLTSAAGVVGQRLVVE